MMNTKKRYISGIIYAVTLSMTICLSPFTVKADFNGMVFDEESKEESGVNFDEVTEWYRINPMSICDGIYFVGTDINAGSYGLTCASTDGNLAVIVFDTIESYYSYHQSHRFTVGEEQDAIDANASSANWLWNEGDQIALNISEGNVLLIKGGVADLIYTDSSIEPSLAETKVGKTLTMYDGIYRIGQDIDAGHYMLTILDGYGAQVALFETEAKYNDFENDDHFTVGEFYYDVEKNGMKFSVVQPGYQCYLNLQEGMVLKLNKGPAIAQSVEMAWAN